MTRPLAVTPIRLHVAPPRRLIWLQAGAAVVSLSALFSTSIPLSFQIGCACAIVASLALTRTRFCAAGHDLEVDGVNGVRVRVDERWLTAVVCADTYISPWLVVLRLKLETGARFSLLLFPGSVPADALRRLRVWLRWYLRN